MYQILDKNNWYDRIVKDLVIPNPKWVENKRHGRWNGNTDPVIKMYREVDDKLFVPRGYIDSGYNDVWIAGSIGDVILVAYNKEEQLHPRTKIAKMYVTSYRQHLEFFGNLRDYQRDAITTCSNSHSCVINAPTGSGKTVMGLKAVSIWGQKTLIIVHTSALMEQWVEAIEKFLHIEKKDIGIIGGGKFVIGEKITVGMVQTVRNKMSRMICNFGCVVVDECHHVPATTFTEIITWLTPERLLGLTATLKRKDGLTKLITMYMGPVRYSVSEEKLIEEGHILKPKIKWVKTDFKSDIVSVGEDAEYGKLIGELVNDTDRNRLICEAIIEATRDQYEPLRPYPQTLVVTDRVEHCRLLWTAITKVYYLNWNTQFACVHGLQGKKQRGATLELFKTGNLDTLICSRQLIGEGFDCPGIEYIVLAYPYGDETTLKQIVGRGLRQNGGKGITVIDIYDPRVIALNCAAKRRANIYKNTYNAGNGKIGG